MKSANRRGQQEREIYVHYGRRCSFCSSRDACSLLCLATQLRCVSQLWCLALRPGVRGQSASFGLPLGWHFAADLHISFALGCHERVPLAWNLRPDRTCETGGSTSAPARAVVENTLFVNPGALCRQARSMVGERDLARSLPRQGCFGLLCRAVDPAGRGCISVACSAQPKSRLLESQVFQQ